MSTHNFLKIFKTVIDELWERWEPQAIVLQSGCDGLTGDPLHPSWDTQHNQPASGDGGDGGDGCSDNGDTSNLLDSINQRITSKKIQVSTSSNNDGWNLDTHAYTGLIQHLLFKTTRRSSSSSSSSDYIPILIFGGGGYNHANTARLWVSILSRLVGEEVEEEEEQKKKCHDLSGVWTEPAILESSKSSPANLDSIYDDDDDDIPEHEQFEAYGPDFTLTIAAGNRNDENNEMMSAVVLGKREDPQSYSDHVIQAVCKQIRCIKKN